ncbi:YbfB/YjiJ family MFS transporter [Shewanella sp. SR44-3]|nr:YbfB/YjiJ family MFS transporter [Shewanella sp. SR44-3]
MLSGTLLPVLIYHSLVSAWLGMGIVALIATMLTWNAWIASDTWQKSENSSYKGEALSFKDLSKPQMMTLGLILSAYTFNAIGYLPHTLFWVDYIVRELKMSFVSGGLYWATFGIGAMIGAILTGLLSHSVWAERQCAFIIGTVHSTYQP